MTATDPTLADLVAAYPAIPDALHWSLYVLGGGVIEAIARTGVSPAVAIAQFKRTVDTVPFEPCLAAHVAAIRAQMDHPQFAAYVAGAMGAV